MSAEILSVFIIVSLAILTALICSEYARCRNLRPSIISIVPILTLIWFWASVECRKQRVVQYVVDIHFIDDIPVVLYYNNTIKLNRLSELISFTFVQPGDKLNVTTTSYTNTLGIVYPKKETFELKSYEKNNEN